MGNQHLPPLIQNILDAACQPRHVRQIEIEKQIVTLSPDFYEAQCLLHAIEAALRTRYDHALLDDARHYFEALTKCLERAEQEYTSE